MNADNLARRWKRPMSASPIVDLEQLVSKILPGTRLMGLDLGAKTIGIALSDPGQIVATPLETLRRTKFTRDAERLAELVKEENVCAIVLGLPLNMNGSEGPRAQATRAFARNLDGHTGRPIVLWDERLSTVAVERTLLEADSSRKRRAEVVDKLAAAYILQGALDRLAKLRG